MNDTITVNNIEYVKKCSNNTSTAMPYVIVRTYSAGVFAGFLEKINGQEGTIRNARRLWYWKGAASLSELAMHGTSNPNECKFPCEVDKVDLKEIIEIDYCTEKAKKSIADVPVWSAHDE